MTSKRFLLVDDGGDKTSQRGKSRVQNQIGEIVLETRHRKNLTRKLASEGRRFGEKGIGEPTPVVEMVELRTCGECMRPSPYLSQVMVPNETGYGTRLARMVRENVCSECRRTLLEDGVQVVLLDTDDLFTSDLMEKEVAENLRAKTRMVEGRAQPASMVVVGKTSLMHIMRLQLEMQKK
jgi:hypothetical protein